MVVHAFNPSTREAETDGSLWVRGQPGLQSKFQDCLLHSLLPNTNLAWHWALCSCYSEEASEESQSPCHAWSVEVTSLCTILCGLHHPFLGLQESKTSYEKPGFTAWVSITITVPGSAHICVLFCCPHVAICAPRTLVGLCMCLLPACWCAAIALELELMSVMKLHLMAWLSLSPCVTHWTVDLVFMRPSSSPFSSRLLSHSSSLSHPTGHCGPASVSLLSVHLHGLR